MKMDYPCNCDGKYCPVEYSKGEKPKEVTNEAKITSLISSPDKCEKAIYTSQPINLEMRCRSRPLIPL